MSRRRNQRKSKPASSTAIVGGPSAPIRASQKSVERLETVLLVLIVLVGAGLRLYALSHSAVEHFDEGVYASNVYFGAPDYAYPQQRFYAPPLLPALIEAGMLAGLPPNVAALLPSFLAGCGTIVALWWFGRNWFSPAVGLGAAVLAALSDFHIAYSATALTDVLLGLWLVLAVDAMARSLLKEDYRWAIGAGIYTGLAWWTKYNGWLPLAIEAAALPLLWLITQQHFLRRLSCFAVTAFTAALIWSPYFFSLQSQGGYGPIAANHAKYVVGFGGWLDSLSRQIASQALMDGHLTLIAIGASMMLVAWSSVGGKRFVGKWKDAAMLTSLFAIVFAAAAWAGSAILVLGIAAIMGLLLEIGRLCHSNDAELVSQRRKTAATLLAAWLCGLTMATPCYTPYPRLMMPWLLAMWILAAICWDDFARRLSSVPRWPIAPKDSGILVPPVMLAMLLLTAVATKPIWKPTVLKPLPFGKDRVGLMQASRSIHELLNQAATPRAVYIYGEPALFFQLKAAGEPFAGPVQEIPGEAAQSQGRDVPTYLVIGPHARRDPQFQSAWPKAKSRWELVASFDYQPSAIVWLDLFDPRKVEPGDQPEETVEVFRLR